MQDMKERLNEETETVRVKQTEILEMKSTTKINKWKVSSIKWVKQKIEFQNWKIRFKNYETHIQMQTYEQNIQEFLDTIQR